MRTSNIVFRHAASWSYCIHTYDQQLQTLRYRAVVTTAASDGASSSFVRPKVPAFPREGSREEEERPSARQFDMCPMRAEKRHAAVVDVV